VALVRARVLTAIARISMSSHVAAARRTGAVKPGRPFQPACERAGVSELPADALAAAVFHCFAAALPEARCPPAADGPAAAYGGLQPQACWGVCANAQSGQARPRGVLMAARALGAEAGTP
jgi:hypothetical protein